MAKQDTQLDTKARSAKAPEKGPEVDTGHDWVATIAAKLDGVRWLILSGLPPSHAHEFLDGLRATHSFVLAGSEIGHETVQWEQMPPKLAIVDLLQLPLERQVMASKQWLRRFPKITFIFLVDPSSQLRVPTLYGNGTYVYWSKERLEKVYDSSNNESELLQHAKRIDPKYGLKDIVLGSISRTRLQEAICYIQTRDKIENEWGFRARHSRGHGVTILFHGPSGSGKTMAAEVIAKEIGVPLFQIDLSSVVSKYVGDTEKHLKTVFQAAREVDGILLFDEGDAIFGARSSDAKSAQDRYSNLEVNYLLQELEAFDGISVLSTNHFANMDSAFLRRFTYSINLGNPAKAEREKIWVANVPPQMPLAKDVDFAHLSGFSLSGGSVKNCIRLAAARAVAAGAEAVTQADFLWSIKRELQKHDQDFSRELVGEEFWRLVGPDWEALGSASNARATTRLRQ